MTNPTKWEGVLIDRTDIERSIQQIWERIGKNYSKNLGDLYMGRLLFEQ